MTGMWKVEGRGGIWLVRRGAGSADLLARGETLSREAAVARVSDWFPDGWGREQAGTLASICHALTGPFPESRPPDARWLKQTVAKALRDGRLTAVRLGLRATIWNVPEEDEPETAKRPEVLGSIRIVVVQDVTWQPVANIELRVTLPEGSQKPGITGEDGSIEHWNIKRGSCDARSPLDGARLSNSFEVVGLDVGEPPPPAPSAGPLSARRRFVAVIQRHKVRRGETLDSVARAHDLTWQQLAEFNWGTSKPDQINRHLRVDVGCREKTADAKNYIFDERDDPGILYVPVPWSRKGLETDRTHTLRVRVPSIAPPRKKLFLFSI